MAISKKLDIYYFVTLIFLLLASISNFLSAINACWIAILLFMIVVAVRKKALKLQDYKLLLKFSVVYLLFVIIRDIYINNLGSEFILSDILFLFKYIFICFIYCAIMREKLIVTVIRVTIHLTIISFAFYALQLIGFGETLYNFSSALNLPNGPGGKETTNFLIFTYARIHPYRNCGFFWEPGVFACFLIVVFISNLFVNGFTFDRNNKILLIALLTTASTTGYLALFVIFFLWYRYKVPRANVWVLVLIPVFCYLLTVVPFLGDKIVKTYKNDMRDLTYSSMRSAALSYRRTHKETLIQLNRFGSMEYIYMQFGNSLILGVSNKYDVILNKTFNVDISNGVSDFLARFGLVGLIFLTYKYGRFCLYYLKRIELMIYGVIIFLIIGTGEPILSLPFIIIFLFIPYPQIGPAMYRPQPNPVNPAVKKFNSPPILNERNRN
jgi:hypothetical protein